MFPNFTHFAVGPSLPEVIVDQHFSVRILHWLAHWIMALGYHCRQDWKEEGLLHKHHSCRPVGPRIWTRYKLSCVCLVSLLERNKLCWCDDLFKRFGSGGSWYVSEKFCRILQYQFLLRRLRCLGDSGLLHPQLEGIVCCRLIAGSCIPSPMEVYYYSGSCTF